MKADLISPFVLTIITSWNGFQNVHNYCSYLCFRDSLGYTLPDALKEPTKDDLPKKRPFELTKKKGNEGAKKPVCLIHDHSAPRGTCRRCLRQYSDSEVLGEFIVGVKDRVFILYVMFSSYEQESIVNTCDGSRACFEFKREYYPDEACQQFYTDPRARIL